MTDLAIAHEDRDALYRARQTRHNRKRKAQRTGLHVFVCKPVAPEITRDCRDAEIAPLHVGLLDLKPGACRYPYGDGPFTFCGHGTLAGKSYCAAHQRLSYGYQTMTVEELMEHRKAYRRKNRYG